MIRTFLLMKCWGFEKRRHRGSWGFVWFSREVNGFDRSSWRICGGGTSGILVSMESSCAAFCRVWNRRSTCLFPGVIVMMSGEGHGRRDH